MTFTQACFLFPVAWVCGALNSIAGEGGLIIFPTLLIAGLPSISANATGTVISWPGHIVGVAAYRRELQTQRRISWLFSGVGLIGGMLGAWGGPCPPYFFEPRQFNQDGTWVTFLASVDFVPEL